MMNRSNLRLFGHAPVRGSLRLLSANELYRTPLRLSEELQGDEKRSWDLGYHHADRQHGQDDSLATDKKAYAKGFAAGGGASTAVIAPPTGSWEQEPQKPQSTAVLPRPAQAQAQAQAPAAPQQAQSSQSEEPIASADVAAHTGSSHGSGHDPRLSGAPNEAEMEDVADSIRHKIQIGNQIACASVACVYEGQQEPDGTNTVVKIDRGDNEATLAKLIMKNKNLQGIRSLPRYIQVIPTDKKDSATGMPYNAIHREDISDLDDTPFNKMSPVKNLLHYYGASLLDKLSRGAPGKSSAATLAAYNRGVGEHREKAKAIPGFSEQFEKIHQDVSKLIKSGIVPCDLHAGNWGKRQNTGEIVMRDVGCATFSKELQAPGR